MLVQLTTLAVFAFVGTEASIAILSTPEGQPTEIAFGSNVHSLQRVVSWDKERQIFQLQGKNAGRWANELGDELKTVDEHNYEVKDGNKLIIKKTSKKDAGSYSPEGDAPIVTEHEDGSKTAVAGPTIVLQVE